MLNGILPIFLRYLALGLGSGFLCRGAGTRESHSRRRVEGTVEVEFIESSLAVGSAGRR